MEVVRLNKALGRMKKHYQQQQHSMWGDKVLQAIILYTIAIM